jgi:hypothetical protein
LEGELKKTAVSKLQEEKHFSPIVSIEDGIARDASALEEKAAGSKRERRGRCSNIMNASESRSVKDDG